ncbi:MAG: hypothetical protein ACYSWW_21535 [Planctomycetota bacterium]|jgi:hypothetical protein
MEVTAGFLIVKTFERTYRDYLASLEKLRELDSRDPRDPMPLELMPGKYRGVARDPIEPWFEIFRGAGLFDEPTEQELAASLFMTELSESGKAEGFFILALDDARKPFGMIQPPVEREIIWARRMDRADTPPPETVFLGYEPIDFEGDFSSIITSVVFFRYRQGSDPAGKYAKILHAKLNKWGLFDTATDAQDYVDSFPLRELPELDRPRHIAEVRAVT